MEDISMKLDALPGNGYQGLARLIYNPHLLQQKTCIKFLADAVFKFVVEDKLVVCEFNFEAVVGDDVGEVGFQFAQSQIMCGYQHNSIE
jgi:hypothetical protein